MACYRLGNMLYIKLQKGKEDMKTLDSQHQIVGTSSLTKRLMKNTKGCGQLTSNNTYFADSWFCGEKNSD